MLLYGWVLYGWVLYGWVLYGWVLYGWVLGALCVVAAVGFNAYVFWQHDCISFRSAIHTELMYTLNTVCALPPKKPH